MVKPLNLFDMLPIWLLSIYNRFIQNKNVQITLKLLHREKRAHRRSNKIQTNLNEGTKDEAKTKERKAKTKHLINSVILCVCTLFSHFTLFLHIVDNCVWMMMMIVCSTIATTFLSFLFLSLSLSLFHVFARFSHEYSAKCQFKNGKIEEKTSKWVAYNIFNATWTIWASSDL